MARPVIASDVPGCRAVVEADVTGFFCAARDSESLAQAMRRFLRLSPAARAAMGVAARCKMEQDYDEALVLAAYRVVLRSLEAKA